VDQMSSGRVLGYGPCGSMPYQTEGWWRRSVWPSSSPAMKSGRRQAHVLGG